MFYQHGLAPSVITDKEFRERLGRSRREIKPALLDQWAVAGIGNLLRLRDFTCCWNPSAAQLQGDDRAAMAGTHGGDALGTGSGDP